MGHWEILEEFDNGYNTNDYDVLINKTEPLFRWQARCRGRIRGRLQEAQVCREARSGAGGSQEGEEGDTGYILMC